MSAVRIDASDEMVEHQSRWLPLLEALSVFLLIMGYIWWLKFYYRPAWLLILVIVAGSHIYHREAPTDLGFRLTNFRRCFGELALPLLVIALVLLTIGGLFGTIRDITLQRAFFVLALYCMWGLVQQYLLNGFFVNRFRAFFQSPGSGWVPVLAAVFFAGAHLPNWFLVSVTCLAGYIGARVYLKYGNLYVLGFAHGLIGSLLYFIVPDSISNNLRVGP